MATIKSKVLQILGENNSTYLANVVNPEYIVEEAIWDTATSIPARLLLAETPEPPNPTDIPLDSGVPTYQDVQASPISIEDKIVLLVLRTQTDYTVAAGPVVTAENYITRPCKEIPYEDSFQALDGGSIYFATNYSPVYWLENSGAVPMLNVAPSAAGSTNTQFLADPDTDNDGSGLQVFTYPRQQVYNAGTSPTAWADDAVYAVGDTVSYSSKNYVCIGAHTADVAGGPADGPPGVGTNVWKVSWEFLETIDNSSEEIEDLFVQRIAMKFLEHKLGNLATQEEDPEMYNLIKDLYNTTGNNLGTLIMNLQKANQEDKQK